MKVIGRYQKDVTVSKQFLMCIFGILVEGHAGLTLANIWMLRGKLLPDLDHT